jgi:bifunctional DNA-binding transcriptional regulator/antitoxin component of YhaV-PrlF toxin-antitoxin module
LTAIKIPYIKGQVTIPVTLRRKFRLTPNVGMEFVADQDGVRIRKRSAGSANPFKKLRSAAKKRLNVDRYIENIRSR